MPTTKVARNADDARRVRRGLSLADGRQNVAGMASKACFSQRQFHRLALQLLGEPPGWHQRRVRLDRAAWLVLTSRATILEIALECGFESHETFTRAFRTRFGDTPSAFRKTRGANLPRSIRMALAIAMEAAGNETESR